MPWHPPRLQTQPFDAATGRWFGFMLCMSGAQSLAVAKTPACKVRLPCSTAPFAVWEWVDRQLVGDLKAARMRRDKKHGGHGRNMRRNMWRHMLLLPPPAAPLLKGTGTGGALPYHVR